MIGPGSNEPEVFDILNKWGGGYVKEFNKRVAGGALKTFVLVLGTLTEPFFRVGMGERYYSSRPTVLGTMLWVATAGLAFVLQVSIATVALCDQLRLHRLAEIFQSPAVGAIVGFVLAILQFTFGFQSHVEMARLSQDGVPHHTRSRGRLRWGRLEYLPALPILVILLLLNLPAFVFFLIGLWLNSYIKGQQDAAIMERYLDAMDAHLENQYLEKAALGECPTELTYLHHPLPKKMHPDMRTGVAASLVGKPVTGMSSAPKRTAAAEKGPQAAEKKLDQPPPPDAAYQTTGFSWKQTIGGAVVFVAFLGLGLAMWFRPEKHTFIVQPSPPAATPRPMSIPAIPVQAQPVPIRTPDTSAPDKALIEAQRKKQEDDARVAREAQERQREDEANAALEAQQAEAARKQREATQKVVDSLKTELASQFSAVSSFESNCLSRLDDNTNKIAKLARSSRRVLSPKNDAIRSSIRGVLQTQREILTSFQTNLGGLTLDSAAVQKTGEQWRVNVGQLGDARRQLSASLDQLDAEIDAAPKKTGFLLIR